jgi:hypothetical protein
MLSWSVAWFDSFTENGAERGRHGAALHRVDRVLLSRLTLSVFYPSGRVSGAPVFLRDNPVYPAAASAYALRRKSEARTRSRNCFGLSGDVGFTTAGAAVFAAVPAASRAGCLVAKSFEGAAGFEIGGIESIALRACMRADGVPQ